jgi:hypothetical protein
MGYLSGWYDCSHATMQVRVCAFSASGLGLQGIGISPDCNPENRATPREVSAALGFMSLSFFLISQ